MRAGRTPGREAGFTLLEILIVLAVLTLAAGVLATRGPARSAALDARGAAGQVARSLRLARSEAIARNRDVAFTMDVARRAFRVGEGAWQLVPGTVQVAVTAIAEEGTAGRILFAPDGGSTGGRVRVAGGGVALAVAVDWLSGRVTVVDGR